MDFLSWFQWGLMAVGAASGVYKMMPKKWQSTNSIFNTIDLVVNAIALNPIRKNARTEGVIVKDE